MNYIHQFFNSAVGHFVKICVYVFLSAGLTAIAGEVTNDKALLGSMGFVVVMAAINGALGMVQKLRDPNVPNIPQFTSAK
jgi:hypothetical protein